MLPPFHPTLALPLRGGGDIDNANFLRLRDFIIICASATMQAIALANPHGSYFLPWGRWRHY